MTLPVSSYEELLTRVRSLTQETRQLQRQLDSPLLDQNDNEHSMNSWENSGTGWNFTPRAAPPSLAVSTPDPLIPPSETEVDPKVVGTQCNGVLARLLGWPSKEEVTGPETKEQDEKRTTPETSVSGDGGQKWGTEYNVWHSVGPIHTSSTSSSAHTPIKQDESGRSYSQQQLGAKVEMVYSLLSMLGTHDREKMTSTLLAMSSSPDSCQAMRQSGCVPLLVQLVHAREESAVVRQRAGQALQNLVHCHADDKRGRREARVLRLLQQLIDFADSDPHGDSEQEDPHPGAAIAALMKLSFDEEHRHAMCQLGALHAIATLIQVDAETHGSQTNNQSCVTVRRYAGMALTNLTFGDSNNKALLCSLQPFMAALVAQLSSPSEDLRQVTASVLRNLSWRADAASKATLREVGAVSALMQAAMEAKKESTLKSILSALWNLSAHCNMNKVEICAVEGSLQYLVEMLSFQAPSRTLAIVENAGGILRNISSHIALREDYRSVLRDQNCLPLLLQQLKSPSLTVVSNACGTLWNLSARCPQDQRALWDLGAVPMLRSLVHSKHRMISMGASAALKNLLASRPDADILDRASRGMPTLLVRKRRALEQELDSTLAETCENIESPERWDSHESVTSTHSENIFDRSSRSHHCHRSGSLQMMKRSGSNAGQTNLSTSSEVVRDQQQSQIQQLDNQMQRLKINESANSSVAVSSNNSINNTASDNGTTSPTTGDLSNKTVDSLPVSPNADSNVPLPANDKPIDYSLKYKDGEADLERRQASPLDETKHASPVPTATPPRNHSPDDNRLMTVEELDTPTDYSLKYHEDENKAQEEYNGQHFNKQADYNMMVRYHSCKPSDMSSTEVELDQPTDYSLKYRENSGCEDVDDERVKEHHESHETGGGGHYAETDLDEALDYYTEDKVQTYCTEGTPYAFSTATSMSDLRVTDLNEQPPKLPEEEEEEVEGERREGEERGSPPRTPADASPAPEPLAGALAPSTPKEEAREGKVVTFETPLMFSRCSSLGSLSSCEPPDDRSSVVSEFSRLTSGMVSPSELPDSPTQTVPPSPRNIKPPQQPPSIKGGAPVNGHAHPAGSVFEDTVSSFKEENTPLHFSTGTSLSSLTFDDEPTPLQQQMIKHQQQRNNTSSSNTTSNSSSTIATTTPSTTGNETSSRNDSSSKDMDAVLAPVSEEEDEDDMLAACINIGMQNSNRQRTTHIRPAPLSRLPKPRHSGIPIKNVGGVNVTATGHHHPHLPQRRHHISSHHPQNQLVMDTEVYDDSTTEFCTEGTPANISHATSHSDLSLICALSDDGSSDQDNIIAECIQSAMPQARSLKNSLIKTDSNNSNNQQPQRQKEDSVSSGNRPQAQDSTTSAQQLPPQIVQSSPRIRDIKGIAAQDETECFAVEGSPCVFSTRSSLSDLTVNSSTTKCRDRCQVVSPAPDDGSSPLSSLEPEVTVLSRQPSTGSLSGDWTEEQALLEQCITSGMPKTKNGQIPSVGAGAVQATDEENSNDRLAVAAEDEDEERNKEALKAAIRVVGVGDVMRESANTWDDDTSPNDVSFPSISLTAPMISSYKSVVDEEKTDADMNGSSHIIRCLDDISLTDSNIIRLEEGKVAIIANMDMESSYMSDLDSVRPPSAMGSLLSLTQSISDADRRKDRMRGFVARRAIGDSSLSWNNIDSIKPPSGMDEIIDLENSILSVASITSEVADSPVSCSEDITLAETSDTTLDYPLSPPQRRVTPKQKRQNVKDRYNTYTINTDQLQNGFSDASEISSTVIDDKVTDSVFEEDGSGDCPKKPQRIQRLTPKQRRLADKDRFRTRTLGVEEQFNNQETAPPMESEQLPEITSTIPSSPTIATREFLKSFDSDELSDDEEVEVEKAKPRVVKPSEKPSTEVKGIRGRKKVRSGIPIVAKSSPAVSSTTHHNSTKDSDKRTVSSIPAPTPPPLQRQGTFTKDEPATPPSGIPVLSKKGSPVKTVKKKQTAQGTTSGSGSGSSTPAVRKLVGRGRAGSLPRTETTKKPALGVRSSVSNQSLKSEALGSNSSLNSTPGQTNTASSTPRWNSNSNLNTAKKDATSKIASLWKKVEDSKRKENGGKDSRVWIAAPSTPPHSKQAA